MLSCAWCDAGYHKVMSDAKNDEKFCSRTCELKDETVDNKSISVDQL